VIILFKTPFTLSSYYLSSEIAKCIVVSHSYEITAGIVTLYLAGYIQPLSIRSYSSTRDLVKPGTYGWDRRPLNHCLLATQSHHYTSPLNKYLCTFFFVSASWSSYSKHLSISHSTITRRRSPHVLWYHISCEITAKYCGNTSRWVYIPPPYKILFLNSRPRQNKVGIVGIVDPRTIVCERPDPPTTPHPKRVSVLFLVVMQKTTAHHIYILAPLHSSQTPHLPSFFTLPSTSTITPSLKQ
jgi:hypothetical protein